MKSPKSELWVGRKDELGALCHAIPRGESRLVWGPMDSGKTALIEKAVSQLSDRERRRCVFWTGPASGRHLLSHFVAQLFALGDPFVRKKIYADGAEGPPLGQWLGKQTSLRLRGILFTALRQGQYRLFLDHFPAATHSMARLMKEIMYRCETPLYLIARGFSQDAIGYAWSLYWHDTLRLRVGPLSGREARDLLELCIRSCSLGSLDLTDFREEILLLSGRLPGSIVRMCELAADARYHSGDRIKAKLVHVDYLIRSDPSTTQPANTVLP